MKLGDLIPYHLSYLAYLSCRSLLLLAEVEQGDQQEVAGSLAAKKEQEMNNRIKN